MPGQQHRPIGAGDSFVEPVGGRPRRHRQWAWLGPIVLLVVLPQLYGLALAPDASGRAGYAVALLGASATVLALATASFLCFHWWITLDQRSGWAGAGLLALSITLLPFRLVGLDETAHVAAATPATIADDVLALAVAVVILAMRAIEFRSKLAPIVLGTVVGTVFATVGMLYTILEVEAWADAPARPGWLGQVLGILVGVAMIVALGQMSGRPPWVRRRFQVVAAVITAAWVVSSDGATGAAHDAGAAEVVAAAMVVAALALATVTGIELLVVALREAEARMWALSDRAELAERMVRLDAEVLHEVRGTVAGISSASRILQDMPGSLVPEHQARLRQLLTSEVERLQHMLTGEREEVVDVDVDAVVANQVTSFRYMGLDVTWEPGGVRAVARPKDVAEIVHTLLGNAVRHAPGARVTVRTSLRGDMSEIAVSDDGSGVPDDLRAVIFERGVSRADSCGQGLGLHIARRLAAEQGGTLRLGSRENTGATFQLRLPVAERAS